jgi:UDP-glucose 4-epimerase
MTRALITGGGGFIGSYLAELLLERGWTVNVLDDLSTSSIKNIAHLKAHPGFTYVLDTVMNRALLLELIDRADVSFHLAAAVGVRLIVERPVHTIETNIRATELVLELCTYKQRPVLLASRGRSTASWTKCALARKVTSSWAPPRGRAGVMPPPRSSTNSSAKAYFREKKLPTVLVRLFNTIGPRQTGQYGMVVPRFVRQAPRGEPITVYGDGRQRRSFTWVGDVVDAMVKLIQHPQAHGEVFNIGHTDEITIDEPAELVKRITESPSEIVCIPYEQAYEAGFEDMARRLPDLTKIQRLIGYRPTLDLARMLEWIIAYERLELEQPTVVERAEVSRRATSAAPAR